MHLQRSEYFSEHLWQWAEAERCCLEPVSTTLDLEGEELFVLVVHRYVVIGVAEVDTRSEESRLERLTNDEWRIHLELLHRQVLVERRRIGDASPLAIRFRP